MTTKAAVISDTHGLLRPEVLEKLMDCDCIVHAGDINRQDLVDQLRTIAPLHVVMGNNDKKWAEGILPVSLRFQIESCRIHLTHIKKNVPKDLTDVDIVIFGHSHKYLTKKDPDTGVLWLNPGSSGRRRFHQEITMAILTIDGQAASVEKILIPHQEKSLQEKKGKEK